MPAEFYEQEHRLALEDAARDIPKLVREAEAFVVGIQELYDDWDEMSSYFQAIEDAEWNNHISCFNFLEDLHKQGRLTKAQEQKFLASVKRPKTHYEQVKYMDLYWPEFLEAK